MVVVLDKRSDGIKGFDYNVGTEVTGSKSERKGTAVMEKYTYIPFVEKKNARNIPVDSCVEVFHWTPMGIPCIVGHLHYLPMVRIKMLEH